MNSLTKFCAIVTLAYLGNSSGALQAQPADSLLAPTGTVHNTAYIEGASLLFWGSVSVNYERWIYRDVWLRIGYGNGYGWTDRGSFRAWGRGPMVMAMYLSAQRSSRFEAGLGASVIYGTGYPSPKDHAEWSAYPAVLLGYRYQPLEGGLVFRAGVTFDYFFGTPIEIGLGYAF